MNNLSTPYAREERNLDLLHDGLPPYNSNDAYVRTDQLNCATPSGDETGFPSGAYFKEGQVARQDPMYQRIIEKRRRDRLNNSLADLSRLIPAEHLKKVPGRVAKTDIIEVATRHLKYLTERAHGVERQTRATGEEHFRAGYQEAVGEAARFLVEVRGYSQADALCAQITSHMQRRVEIVDKGEALPREKLRCHPNSASETNSSCSSSQGFINIGVTTQAQAPAPQPYEEPYPMDYDRDGFAQHLPSSVSRIQLADSDVLDCSMPLGGRRNLETNPRAVRKPEHSDDFLQPYKFKNDIERRFLCSKDSDITEAKGMSQQQVYTHKRRRVAEPVPSTSTSNSGSTEETRDTSPQDTSNDSPYTHHYEKPAAAQDVPVFALSALGNYYVPLNIDYACLSRQLGPYDAALDPRAMRAAAPLHAVTIDVNYQSCSQELPRQAERNEEWSNQ